MIFAALFFMLVAVVAAFILGVAVGTFYESRLGQEARRIMPTGTRQAIATAVE